MTITAQSLKVIVICFFQKKNKTADLSELEGCSHLGCLRIQDL